MLNHSQMAHRLPRAHLQRVLGWLQRGPAPRVGGCTLGDQLSHSQGLRKPQLPRDDICELFPRQLRGRLESPLPTPPATGTPTAPLVQAAADSADPIRTGAWPSSAAMSVMALWCCSRTSLTVMFVPLGGMSNTSTSPEDVPADRLEDASEGAHPTPSWKRASSSCHACSQAPRSPQDPLPTWGCS